MPLNKSWHDYSESLIERGRVLIDVSFLKSSNKEIKKMNIGKVGAPFQYPDSYVQFLAFLKIGFKIPYRMVQGIVHRLSEYVRIVEEIHFTHIGRRMLRIKPSIGNDNDNDNDNEGGQKFKLRENKKLRPILERLRNHSHIHTVGEKPVALKWVSDDSSSFLKNSCNTSLSTTCAPCDQCDPNFLRTEKIEDTISEGTGKVEEGTEKNPEPSIGSHRAHRSQLTQRLALRHSSAAYVLTNNVLEDGEDVAIENSNSNETGGESA
jgi:hypothetical protein